MKYLMFIVAIPVGLLAALLCCTQELVNDMCNINNKEGYEK